MVEDVSAACELFFPIYDRSNFVDGLVTVPISPHLAHDTGATVAEARRMFAEVGWPNLMIEVPATTEGIPAIQQLITDGINVQRNLAFLGGRLPQGRGSLHPRPAEQARGRPIRR